MATGQSPRKEELKQIYEEAIETALDIYESGDSDELQTLRNIFIHTTIQIIKRKWPALEENEVLAVLERMKKAQDEETERS